MMSKPATGLPPMGAPRPHPGRLLIAAMLLFLIAWQLQRSLPGPALWDFGSFVASGRAAAAGLDPYGIYPPLTFRIELPGFALWNPNLNPPAALPLFDLLGRMDPHRGFRIWWSVTAVAYGVLVALLVRRYGRGAPLLPTLLALAAAGFWDTAVLGQIYVPLALAAAVAWLLLESGRPWLAGLLIGLVVAVKPNFIVWPGLLFLAGHWRPAVASGISAGLLWALPVVHYGPQVYAQWIAVIAGDAGRAAFLTNAALSGLAARLGLPEAGAAASLALLAGLALWAFRTRPDPLRASKLALVAALLAAPLAWVHYSLFLLPVAFATRPTWRLRAAIAIFLLPVPLLLETFLEAPVWLQASLGSAYGWGMLLVLAALVPGPGKGPVAPGPAVLATPDSPVTNPGRVARGRAD